MAEKKESDQLKAVRLMLAQSSKPINLATQAPRTALEGGLQGVNNFLQSYSHAKGQRQAQDYLKSILEAEKNAPDPVQMRYDLWRAKGFSHEDAMLNAMDTATSRQTLGNNQTHDFKVGDAIDERNRGINAIESGDVGQMYVNGMGGYADNTGLTGMLKSSTVLGNPQIWNAMQARATGTASPAQEATLGMNGVVSPSLRSLSEDANAVSFNTFNTLKNSQLGTILNQGDPLQAIQNIGQTGGAPLENAQVDVLGVTPRRPVDYSNDITKMEENLFTVNSDLPTKRLQNAYTSHSQIPTQIKQDALMRESTIPMQVAENFYKQNFGIPLQAAEAKTGLLGAAMQQAALNGQVGLDKALPYMGVAGVDVAPLASLMKEKPYANLDAAQTAGGLTGPPPRQQGGEWNFSGLQGMSDAALAPLGTFIQGTPEERAQLGESMKKSASEGIQGYLQMVGQNLQRMRQQNDALGPLKYTPYAPMLRQGLPVFNALQETFFPQKKNPKMSSLPMNAPQNMPKSPHAQTALAAAQKYGLPPGLFLSQINAESAWNPNAKSPAGALGIAQFMPATAKGLGVNPMDPNSALDGAARLMSQHFNTYKKQGHDDVEAYKRALSAYNAGPGAVQKYNGVPPYKETQNYVKRIMAGLM